MKSIADELPPDIARQIHPDWRKNETAYWAMRDHLLSQYRGKWIGFADGAVIVSGVSPVRVLHAAQNSGRHPFVICVGREEAASRIRRSVFVYDTNYVAEALPVLNVEFRQASAVPGVVLDRVIPDTGADASVLPWSDCQLLRLDLTQGTPGYLEGVAGASAASLTFQIWACLDGQEYQCRVHADFAGRERILGRDVLNQLDVLFRGAAGEVVINP